MTAYILFFLAGLGFGYAAPGRTKLIPFVFPLLLGLFALLIYGFEGAVILRLIIALIVTALGILLGTMLDQRGGSEAAPA